MSKLLGRLLLSVVMVAALFGALAQGAPRAHAQELCAIYEDLLEFPPGPFRHQPLGPTIDDMLFELSEGTVVYYRITVEADDYMAMVVMLHLPDPASLLPGTIVHQTQTLNFPVEGTFVVPADGTYLIAHMVDGVSTAGATIHVSITYECGSGEVVQVQPAGPTWGSCGLTDGRINADAALDCAAPVAVYLNNGGIQVYGVDPITGQGGLALSVTQKQLVSASSAADENTLLGESILPGGQTMQLYWLASGEFSLITSYPDGKPYVIVWATGADDLYHAG